jgi:hexosaminidase
VEQKHKKSKLKSIIPYIIVSILLVSVGTGGILFSFHYNAVEKYPIIPRPSTLEPQDGSFILTEDFVIYVDNSSNELVNIAQMFSEKLEFSFGREFELLNLSTNPSETSLILKLGIVDEDLGEEGYKLEINQTNIEITAEGPNGVYYGIQSLSQLFPSTIESKNGLSSEQEVLLPCVFILDSPRFPYRGMHLDVGRHFFPVDFIKKYIDLMAFYKYNTFHWHLTEDQGWRIEIKNYSLLTEVGAYRTDEHGGIYGGFYTQEEVREIVQYASDHYITIIPEIEMPGHSVAALAAYPNLSCTGGPFEVSNSWGIHEDVFCAGNDEVFTFLETILLEVMDLFPSPYIHIGGDEVPKTRWESCPKCQQRIVDEGLQNEEELQSYFISRINSFVQSKNRSIIGWNEIVEGGLAENATVMAWNSWDAAINAVRLNHKVIMTPTEYCYFDYYQGNPLTEPRAIGGLIPLSKVYNFEPIPSELNTEEAKLILGAQGNVWTEYIDTAAHVEYMSVPRICALSEVVWSSKELKNWFSFQIRLSEHYKILEEINVNYRRTVILSYLNPNKI